MCCQATGCLIFGARILSPSSDWAYSLFESCVEVLESILSTLHQFSRCWTDTFNMLYYLPIIFGCLQTVLAHSLGPSIFGGSNALQAFGVEARAPSRHFPRDHAHREAEADFPSGALLNSRAEKMTCGAVNGTCPAGYW